ncbi:MAG: response regulator transcription factor [Lachnospiraceae bacterium]|nr:response regulator transcription factor [Lachnospiraceae bacterium]
MIEFNGQDSSAFDEVMEVLKRYPDFDYVQMNDDSILSVPGLEIYPSRRKIYRGRKEISLTAKEYDLFYGCGLFSAQRFRRGFDLSF